MKNSAKPALKSPMKMWLGALVTAVLIIAAVPFARPAQNYLKSAFGAHIFILITLAFVPIGFEVFRRFVCKSPEKRIQRIIAFIVIAALYAVRLKSLDVSVERFHLIEYGVLAVFVAAACNRHGLGRVSYAWGVASSLLVGLADELFQWMRPERVGEFRDVLINIQGGILALLILILIVRDKNMAGSSSTASWAVFFLNCSVLTALSCWFISTVQIFGYANCDPEIGCFRSFWEMKQLKAMTRLTYEHLVRATDAKTAADPGSYAKRYWYDREAQEHFDQVRLLFEMRNMDAACREYKLVNKYFKPSIEKHGRTFSHDIGEAVQGCAPNESGRQFASKVADFMVVIVNRNQLFMISSLLVAIFITAGIRLLATGIKREVRR
jgi:hypothetical protein